MGYSAETDMQRYWRDVRLFRIGPVTNEMARNGIAEGLGLPGRSHDRRGIGPPAAAPGRGAAARRAHTVAGYESWLGHDALYSEPVEEPHPVMAFVAATGLGVSVASCSGCGYRDVRRPDADRVHPGVPGEFRADVEYGCAAPWCGVRKSGRTLGVFDLLTARFELFDAAGSRGGVTNVYALPGVARREGAPVSTRRSRGAAGLDAGRVDPEKMKLLPCCSPTQPAALRPEAASRWASPSGRSTKVRPTWRCW